jgi:RelE-like toxin of type II toxin-antitoxin system HigB
MPPQKGYLAGAAHQIGACRSRLRIFLFVVFRWGTARRGLLKGDRAGQHSIRINDQWRVCFRFADGDVFDVEITDYH